MPFLPPPSSEMEQRWAPSFLPHVPIESSFQFPILIPVLRVSRSLAFQSPFLSMRWAARVSLTAVLNSEEDEKEDVLIPELSVFEPH